MKKLKHKIIIPIVTALSSLALVAPCACANTSKVVNSDNNSSIVNSINYTTITYNTADNVTLIGSNRVKARTGVIFGTVLKPEARHSLNYEFKGWSTSQDKADIINNYTELTKSSYSLYPIFAPKARSVEISGDKQVIASVSSTYTLQSVPSGAFLTPVWSEVSRSITSGTATFNTSTGVLTTTYDAIGTITIGCTDSATGIAADNLTIDIVPPYMVNDGLWTTTYVANAGYEWRKIALEDGCDICLSKDTVSTTKLDGTAGAAIYKTALSTLYIGNEVTAIPDNFCVDMRSYNGEIVFQSTSKCAFIGKGFMYNCGAWDNGKNTTTGAKPFTLPNSVKTIDDEFLYDCSGFNQVLTLPSDITWIGESFMNNCKLFNQNLAIPDSVTHVGNDFMVNAYDMVSTITINCEATAFSCPSSGVAGTLTTDNSTEPCYQTGITIAGNAASDFVGIFPSRIKSETITTQFRNLSDKANFLKCDWQEVIDWVEKLETDPSTEMQTQFCKHFLNGTEAIASLSGFVGLERSVTINNIEHKVRVIGVNRDTITSGTHANSTAIFTFELVTVLSSDLDSDYPTLYSDWDKNYNFDYLNSSQLRKNLNNTDESVSAVWYKQPGTSTETSSETRSALQMLTDSTTGTPVLTNAIKETKHYIATVAGGKWNVGTVTNDTEYSDKLFIPNYYNLTSTASEKCYETAANNPTYKYYTDAETAGKGDEARIKYNINDEAISYKLPSPYLTSTTMNGNVCFVITKTGTFSYYGNWSHGSISFAFCI